MRRRRAGADVSRRARGGRAEGCGEVGELTVGDDGEQQKDVEAAGATAKADCTITASGQGSFRDTAAG
jgi:hypothetical protein